MGMYDSFYFDVKCPSCHKESRRTEFQTKALDKELNKYEIGDQVSTKKFIIHEGLIKGLMAFCNRCETQLEGDVVIRDGKVKSILNLVHQ